MPPFAGDTRASPGSNKRIAQIPRKAYRWALRGDFKKKFFGPKCERSRGRRTLPCVPTKHEQLEGLPRIVRPKNRVKKKQFRCGMQFCCWVLQHFFTRGAAVDQILRITLLSIKICPRTQCEGEAMQNSIRKEWFNISLTPLRTTSKQASKIWPLARGFLPYKRESNEYKSY